MIFALVTLALLVSSVSAGCDNQCSGHGTCGLNGVCTCYDNWGLGMSHDSGDCSERICPFEFAWVDTPDATGAHHKYTECASKGICDRETGQCECFAGYEGKACQRTTCPNSCSGHGQCEYIENMAYATTGYDYQLAGTIDHDQHLKGASMGDISFSDGAKTFDYKYWDKTKTRGCVCDPEWADVDCSKRMCPYGNDVMDHRLNMVAAQKYQVQKIEFQHIYDTTFDNEKYTKGRTFALTFKSKLNETFTTIPIVLKVTADNGGDIADKASIYTMTKDIEAALKNLPNRVIDDVKVAANIEDTPGAGLAVDQLHINITFTGDAVQGPQNLIMVKTETCGDGCTPKLDGLTLAPRSHNVTEDIQADFNSYECGRRGKCDYDSGLCECFEGYTGLACNTITALV
jgi:hypothetical protein